LITGTVGLRPEHILTDLKWMLKLRHLARNVVQTVRDHNELMNSTAIDLGLAHDYYILPSEVIKNTGASDDPVTAFLYSDRFLLYQVERYLKWFQESAAILNEGGSTTGPDITIDLIWHAHMLCPSDYHRFASRYMTSGTINHYPLADCKESERGEVPKIIRLTESWVRPIKVDPSNYDFVEAFPRELCIHIFSYLSPMNLFVAGLVSSSWRSITSASILWSSFTSRNSLAVGVGDRIGFVATVTNKTAPKPQDRESRMVNNISQMLKLKREEKERKRRKPIISSLVSALLPYQHSREEEYEINCGIRY